VNLWTVGCADPRKLHSTPQQDRMNLISGKGETRSRLPAFSLFLPGTCPNTRDRRTCSSQPRRSGSADGSIADSCRSRFLRAWAFASWRPREVRDSAIRSGSTVCSRQAVRPILSDHGCGGRRAFFTNPARADGTSAASHIRRGASRRHRSCQRRRARLYQGGCNYIYDTYGRFPGAIDAMHLMWVMQAHHIDTDYYDRFFRPGAYGSTHAVHIWCAPCRRPPLEGPPSARDWIGNC
jgi:hypothetical protein